MNGPLNEAKNVYIEYNSLIRAFLREVMGVKLEIRQDEGSRGSIQVELLELPDDPKLSAALNTALSRFDLEQFSRVKALRDALKTTSIDFRKEPEKFYHYKLLINCEQYLRKNDVNAWIKEFISRFSNKPFHSPFGVYNIRYRRVALYVKPIYFYCRAKNLNFKTFVIMVLTHELAHGYSHIGLDKDRQSWAKIGSSDLDIVEGVAQYYTRRFFQKYSNRFSDGLHVFDCLIEDQDDCYKNFLKWQVTDEQLYRAFVELRRNGRTKTAEFIELMESSKNAIMNPLKKLE
jgi:hypothetical protein